MASIAMRMLSFSFQLPAASKATLLRQRNPTMTHGTLGLEAGSWELGAKSRFFHGPDLSALVIPAVRANLVRRFRLAALRAGTDRHRLQRIVRAALGRPRFRMPAFRIGHD
jgi:hypothetical protein